MASSRENEVTVVILLRDDDDNGVVAKISLRNIGDLVILESRKVFWYHHSKQLRQVRRSRSKMKLPRINLFLLLR